MKQLNNKGVTVAELIVTFVLVMSISIGLFKIVDSYRTRQQKESALKEINSFKNEVIKNVYDDINKYGVKTIEGVKTIADKDLTEVLECEGYNQGVKITFKNSDTDSENVKHFCVGKEGILYGDLLFKKPNDFITFTNKIIYLDSGKIQVSNKYKQIFSIKVEIKHSEIKEPVNLNIVATNTINPEMLPE